MAETIPNHVDGVFLDHDQITGFCRRNRVSKLALFGSILRADFKANSDVDMLVEFEPEAKVGLIRLAELEAELSQMVGRKVDLRTPAELSRYFRQQVTESAATLYAQG